MTNIKPRCLRILRNFN